MLSKINELATIQNREKIIKCAGEICSLAMGSNVFAQSLKSEPDDHCYTARKEPIHMAAQSFMQATAQVAERYNQQSQDRLLKAAADLNAATENAMKLQPKLDAINALVEAVKQAAASSTQLVAPLMVAIRSNYDPITANKLNIENQALQKSIPNMIKAASEVTDAPTSSLAQQALIAAAEDFIDPAFKTMVVSKTAQPTIVDQSAKLMLENATDKLGSALNKLQDAAQIASEVFETTPAETACEIDLSCRDDSQKLEDLATWQKEIESSVQKVKNATQKINDEDFEPVGNFEDAAKRLEDSAQDTIHAAGNLMEESRTQIHDVILAASQYSTEYENLVDAGLNVAAHTSGQDRVDIVHQINNIAKVIQRHLGSEISFVTYLS